VGQGGKGAGSTSVYISAALILPIDLIVAVSCPQSCDVVMAGCVRSDLFRKLYKDSPATLAHTLQDVLIVRVSPRVVTATCVMRCEGGHP